ncbi:MAG: site-specific integrase, partial [Firmicutes bacterium]|nr:site-specific integrase [Bacillota bacterium]
MKIDDRINANLREVLITIRPGAENLEAAQKNFLKHHHLKGTSQATIDWYTNHLRTFIEYLRENDLVIVPQKIDKSIIEDYIMWLLDQDIEIETVNGKIRTLKAFFNYLYEENMIPT